MSQILRQNISGFPSACPPQVDDATMRLPRPFSYNAALRQDFPNGFRHQTPRRFMLTATFDL